MLIPSPLNYTGGKYRLLPQIVPLLPKDVDVFVDLFCGGGNVGINMRCNKVVYNDIDRNIINLFQTFKNIDKREIFTWIHQLIHKYDLSNSCKYGYEYYQCTSSEGLGKYNKEKFNRLRDAFNGRTRKNNYDYHYYAMLFVLIVYAFNNQLRFNSRGEYNLPVGKRDFNEQMQRKLSAFIDRLQGQENEFTCTDFRRFNTDGLTINDLVYIDPPYLITCATYNEQGGWGEEMEKELLSFIDRIDKQGVRFALSNVLRSKGRQNDILIFPKMRQRYGRGMKQCRRDITTSSTEGASSLAMPPIKQRMHVRRHVGYAI